MKKRNEKKKNKGSTAKVNKRGNKKTSTRKSKSVRKNKRGREIGINELSKEERQIYRAFETLLEIDEVKIKGAKVTKKRDDNLFVIPLNQKGFKNKIAALQNADFSGIEKFLDKQKIEPLYAFVALKIKKPDEVGYYFNGEKSKADMVVNADNTKAFAINVMIGYYNQMQDLIDKQYDENTKVYNVVELSIRFLFPTK